MEAIRVKDKEWQLAGVHYVRTEAMCNGFGVSLEMEFGEDKAGDEYIPENAPAIQTDEGALNQ